MGTISLKHLGKCLQCRLEIRGRMAYTSVQQVKVLANVGMHSSKRLYQRRVFDDQLKGPVGTLATIGYLRTTVSFLPQYLTYTFLPLSIDSSAQPPNQRRGTHPDFLLD